MSRRKQFKAFLYRYPLADVLFTATLFFVIDLISDYMIGPPPIESMTYKIVSALIFATFFCFIMRAIGAYDNLKKEKK